MSMERNTRQRAAIRDVFEATNRPLSPVEVLEAAQRQVPGLGIATVYRTLKSLQDEQWLTVVELPGDSARYERAHLAHHHHFQCRACNRVFEVNGCPPNVAKLAPPGFEVEAHEVVLYGRCDACVGAS